MHRATCGTGEPAQFRIETMRRLIPAFLFLLVGFSVSGHWNLAAQDHPEPPVAVNGTLDLRQWDFKNNGPVDLNGEWQFYWSRLIGPIDLDREHKPELSGVFSLPAFWDTAEIDGKALPGKGYATFVLSLFLPKEPGNLAVKVGDIQTAYSLFVNGEKIAVSGSVGTNENRSVPKYSPLVADLETVSSELTLVLQVSNFHHRRGGVFDAIKLGREEDIRALREDRLVMNVFLMGCIFIMALYHIGLYALRRSDKVSLYFGIFCFIVASRTLLLGERYIDHLLPFVDWETIHKLEYLSFYLAVPVFAFFVNSLFPHEFLKLIHRITTVVGLSFSLLVLTTPAIIYTYSVQIYQLFSAAFGLYTIFVLVLAIKRKRNGSIILFGGFAFLFVIVINDILHANQIVNTGYFLAVGIFVFIFSQAFLISLKFSRMFQVVENQALELTETISAYRKEIVQRKKLENDLVESHEKFERSRIAIILGLAKLAEYRDEDTGMHLERMREYSRALAKELSLSPEYKGYITKAYVDDLYQSAILHDIGKVGIPDSVLLKPGKLTPEEFDTIKLHCVIGGDAILNVESQIKIQSFLSLGREIAYCHHEKWNGSGYPKGLKNEKIPLSARIIALADVYDALTSERPYKKALSHEEAKSIIFEGDGQHFDPKVVQAFIARENEFNGIRRSYCGDEGA